MVVIGLASLIVGEVAFGRPSIWRNILSVVLGAIVYRVIIAFVLALGLSPNDLKLISAVIVAAAISYPVALAQYRLFRRRREARQNA